MQATASQKHLLHTPAENEGFGGAGFFAGVEAGFGAGWAALFKRGLFASSPGIAFPWKQSLRLTVQKSATKRGRAMVSCLLKTAAWFQKNE